MSLKIAPLDIAKCDIHITHQMLKEYIDRANAAGVSDAVESLLNKKNKDKKGDVNAE